MTFNTLTCCGVNCRLCTGEVKGSDPGPIIVLPLDLLEEKRTLEDCLDFDVLDFSW